MGSGGSMEQYFITAGFVILYLAIMVAVFIPSKHLIYSYLPTKSKAFNSFISKYPLLMIFTVFVITIAAYYVLFRFRNMNLFKVCSFSPVSFKNMILLIVLGLFMLVTIVGFSSFDFVLKKLTPLEEYINGTMKTSGSPVALVLITCAVVLCEEIIFRGVIFGEMKSNIPVILAALIHAAIYALIIGEPVVGIVSFITCLIYAFLYTVTGSLWSTVVELY